MLVSIHLLSKKMKTTGFLQNMLRAHFMPHWSGSR